MTLKRCGTGAHRHSRALGDAVEERRRGRLLEQEGGCSKKGAGAALRVEVAVRERDGFN
jgi:hypothetical protein